MSIVFFTGFELQGVPEHYGFATSGSASIGATAGRSGTPGLQLSGGTVAYLHSNIGTVILGGAFNIPSLPGSDTVLVAFMDGTTTQVDLRITSAGAIRATRNGTNLGVSANGVVAASNWFYLEARVVIHDTAGAVEVRVNGNTVLNLSGVNTRATSNDYVNRLELRTVTNPTRVDDLYYLNVDATPPNGFLGDQIVRLARVAGAGTFAQWTPNGASANWDCVDEIPPDGDATFNSTQTVGRIDSFQITPITGIAAVTAVAVRCFARKDDAASRAIEPGLVIGGTFYSGGTVYLPDNYIMATAYFPTNPAGGGAWTISAVNAAEIGYRSAA